MRPADEPLWEQAEREAGTESLSTVLNEALRKHLQGRPAGPAEVWLAQSKNPVMVDVEPLESGWQIRIPQNGEERRSPRIQVLEVLAQAIGWDNNYRQNFTSTSHDPIWVWVPSQLVLSIVWRPNTPAAGIDYVAKAREAWTILWSRVGNQSTLTYGDLGHALGGLHPLHDVPQVLDIIQLWCHEHHIADLTGLVVSQRTGLPGRDYWRQNGWGDLAAEKQKQLWQESLEQLSSDPHPTTPPF